MSIDRQTWTDIAKATGFVLAGTLGVLALVAFFQGFRDGYSGGAGNADTTSVEQPAETDAGESGDNAG